MKKQLVFPLLFFSLFILIALFYLVPSANPISTEKIAKQYLVEKGLNVIAYEGSVQTYTLEKEMLSKLPYMSSWGVMNIDPSPYLGRKIEVHRLVVTNHSLDNYRVSIE